MIDNILAAVRYLLSMGGTVMAIHMAMSVLALAVVIYKLWQQSWLGVGRHAALNRAIAAWDRGDRTGATAALSGARSYLAPVLQAGIDAPAEDSESAIVGRLTAEAEAGVNRVESGYRLLDLIAQSAPLLGLLGTVLGMVQAFQAMQDAGSAVDPSVLAGGIWVALLTTVSGLSVALPVTAALTWLESRAASERVMADRAIQAAVAPGLLTRGAGALAHAA